MFLIICLQERWSSRREGCKSIHQYFRIHIFLHLEADSSSSVFNSCFVLVYMFKVIHFLSLFWNYKYSFLINLLEVFWLGWWINLCAGSIGLEGYLTIAKLYIFSSTLLINERSLKQCQGTYFGNLFKHIHWL